MNRRHLLKLLPSASILQLNWHGKQAGAGFEVDGKKKVILFVNENVIPARLFNDMFKDFHVEVVVCPVCIPDGQTIDDVVRLYDITDK